MRMGTEIQSRRWHRRMEAATAAVKANKQKKTDETKRNAMEYEKIMLEHLLRNVIIPERVLYVFGKSSAYLVWKYVACKSKRKKKKTENKTRERKREADRMKKVGKRTRWWNLMWFSWLGRRTCMRNVTNFFFRVIAGRIVLNSNTIHVTIDL